MKNCSLEKLLVILRKPQKSEFTAVLDGRWKIFNDWKTWVDQLHCSAIGELLFLAWHLFHKGKSSHHLENRLWNSIRFAIKSAFKARINKWNCSSYVAELKRLNSSNTKSHWQGLCSL